ncbi:MAG TPA: DNA/RNA helicase domain-containing protein, partial [Herbaspirillum sp.]
MRVYAAHGNNFIEDCERNQIAEKLRSGFSAAFGAAPNKSEVQSWRNSLRALALVLSRAKLTSQGVLLEYKLPLSSKRIDCVLCGYNAAGAPSVVIVELKQWETCKEAEGPYEVISFVNGGDRELLHPSEQARRYAQSLEDSHEAFYKDTPPITAHACAFLHNYLSVKNDPLKSEKFKELISKTPIFNSDDIDEFVDFLRQHVGSGDGLSVLSAVEQMRYRPSKKLMHHVSNVIQNQPEYLLLDEQQVAFDSVFTALKNGVHNRLKQVVIIKGGPGTGKSVIAINLAAKLLASDYSAHYVTGSKAFTETLRKIIGPRGSDLFTYSNNYMQALPDSVDVLITDEAHRIRDISSNRFTRAEKKSDLKQVEELIRACRVSVFLIDDDQVVRPGEIGSSAY